jgi:hypothetical protein
LYTLKCVAFTKRGQHFQPATKRQQQQQQLCPVLCAQPDETLDNSSDGYNSMWIDSDDGWAPARGSQPMGHLFSLQWRFDNHERARAFSTKGIDYDQ